jgi:alpha-mannosidase
MFDSTAWTWEEWYPVHRDLLLWHEHTWGSWCSISDPELPFTVKQWEYKKSFLDSAQHHLDRIQSKHPMQWKEWTDLAHNGEVQDFEVNPATGGLRSLLVKGKECAFSSNERNLFCYSYVQGLGENARVYYPEKVHIVYQKEDDHVKEVHVRFFLEGTNQVEVNYNLNKQKGVLVVKHKLDKRKCLNKESIHVCLDVNMNRPTLSYGSSGHLTHYKKEQLQGSNYEFVCITDQLVLEDLNVKLTIGSPDINLVEVGQRIDEKQVKGAKVWARQAQDPSHLFLYVLNNYWHTNFKAYQEGILEFENYISMD